MDVHGKHRSDQDLTVADAAAELVLAIDRKLITVAHSRVDQTRDEVRAAISIAELALRQVLLPLRE